MATDAPAVVAASNIKYVDQNGNPINPPSAQQPVIKYVDQNGNPIAPPSQPAAQPTVKYVDQYGNHVAPPIAASPQPQPQPSVKYVDQFGNPVAPPINAAANIRYVVQNGNPVPSPSNVYPANASAVNAAETAKPSGSKEQNTAAAVFGIFGILFFVIAFISDNLARDGGYNGWETTTTCGFTEVRVKCEDQAWDDCTDYEYSYDELCDLQKTFGGGSYDGPDFCATSAAAGLTLTCMVFATLLGLIGIFYTQQWCPAKPFCCQTSIDCTFGRSTMLVSFGLAVFSFIFWYSIADYCIGTNEIGDSYGDDRFGMGPTLILFIIGTICMFIGGLLSRKQT